MFIASRISFISRGDRAEFWWPLRKHARDRWCSPSFLFCETRRVRCKHLLYSAAVFRFFVNSVKDCLFCILPSRFTGEITFAWAIIVSEVSNRARIYYLVFPVPFDLGWRIELLFAFLCSVVCPLGNILMVYWYRLHLLRHVIIIGNLTGFVAVKFLVSLYDSCEFDVWFCVAIAVTDVRVR